jgi:hypothetical protein
MYATQTKTLAPIAEPVQRPAARAAELLAAGGLAVIAAVHLVGVSEKFAEVPYLGVGYVGLIVGAIVSIGLLVKRDRRGWMLGGGLALATIIGFVLTRTVGLPASSDDIGNWGEPLGIVALIAEAAVVAMASNALARTRPT